MASANAAAGGSSSGGTSGADGSNSLASEALSLNEINGDGFAVLLVDHSGRSHGQGPAGTVTLPAGTPVRYHRRGSDVFVVTRLLPGEQVRVQLSGPCSLEDISMDDYNSRLNGNGAPADAEGKPAAPANVTMEPSDGKEEMTDGVQSVTNSVVEEGYA